MVERDFVAAAEAIGVPRARIMFSEIFPNILSPLLVEASLRLTYAIGVIAALAFLGFTTNPGAPDWGLMINENRIALTVQPWGVVLPVAAIALLTIYRAGARADEMPVGIGPACLVNRRHKISQVAKRGVVQIIDIGSK